MEHKLSVFQEVDEDIHRSIQVGQEAGEGAGTFLTVKGSCIFVQDNWLI